MTAEARGELLRLVVRELAPFVAAATAPSGASERQRRMVYVDTVEL